MGYCPFCESEDTPSPREENKPRGLLRRIWETMQWLFPAALLALVPKCPLCVAGYIALATGLGISLPAATWIRTGMIATCLGALTFLSIRLVTRFLKRRRLALSK